MMRSLRDFFRWVVCFGVVPLAPVSAEERKEEPGLGRFKGYNLLFVSFDALQASHVGALGYSRNVTPTIDSIAKQSFGFKHAYSVASWTVPASMSWFTGVYPCEHRMTNKFAVYNSQLQKPANLKDLSPNLVTLADIFKRNGYVTGGFTGNAGVSGGFGFDQGFDTYFFERNRFGSMEQSIPKALEWLKANKEKKFFAFLHGYDCHGQYSPAEGYDYRFVEKGYDKKFTGSELEQEVLREEGLAKGFVSIRDEDVRFWRAIYDEKIQRVDARFAKFLQEFHKLGVSEKTIIVLTSDHGTEFYEHRRFDHGYTLFNEQLHVPLFIQLPGITKPRTTTDRIGSIDLMPTLLELLQLPIPADAKGQLRGTSLVSAMQGQPVKRDIFSETDYREYTYKRSIITPEGWKLILTMETGARELYFLPDDRSETKNLVPDDKKRADEFERRIFAHFKSLGHDLTARRWTVGLNPVYASQAKDPPKK